MDKISGMVIEVPLRFPPLRWYQRGVIGRVRDAYLRLTWRLWRRAARKRERDRKYRRWAQRIADNPELWLLKRNALVEVLLNRKKQE